MAENAAINQILQLGVESASGTQVAATKIMQSLQVTPKAMTQGQTAIAQGSKFPVGFALTEEASSWAMNMPTPSFGEMAYAYASAIGNPSVTPLGSNGAQTWVFNTNALSPDTRKTFTLEHGSSVRARYATYGILQQLGLKFSRKAISGSGTIIAQQINEGFTLTALTPVSDVQTVSVSGTPTGGSFTLTFKGQTTAAIPYNATAAAVATALNALSTINGGVTTTGGPLPGTPVVVTFAGLGGVQPVMTHTDTFTGGSTPAAAIAHTTSGVAIYPEYPLYPLQAQGTTLYLDSSWATLGTTAMTKAFSADVTLGSLVDVVYPMYAGSPSFSGHVETENKDTVNIMLEADNAGANFLSQFRNGSSIFARILTQSPAGITIDGTNRFSHQLDCCIKLDNPFSYQVSDNLWQIQYTGRIFFDPSSGNALKATLVNALAAL